MNIQWFIWVYRIGITIAIIMGIAMIIGLKLQSWIFWLSMSHMFLMIFLAYYLPSFDRITAGLRIQTAGYLYTLVGFAILLVIRSTEKDFNLSSIWYPVGSALFTSIIGWFAGGEISEGINLSDESSIRSQNEKAVRELHNFTIQMADVHNKYIKVVNELTNTHAQLNEVQRKALSDAITTAAELDNLLNPVKETFSQLGSTLTETARQIDLSLGTEFRKMLIDIYNHAHAVEQELNKTVSTVGDTIGYLENLKKLVPEIENFINKLINAHALYTSKMNDLVNNHAQLHKAQQKALSDAITTAGELDNLLKPVKGTFSQLGSTLTETARQIDLSLGTEFRKVLADIYNRARAVEQELTKTASAAEDMEKYLRQSRLLIDQLEKLMNFIYSERRN